jgi:hypothetical protein
VAFLGNAAANSPSASFSLGMPYGVNAASIPYLHLSALEMAPKCDDANATMKSYRRLIEGLSTIANMIETTDAHTNVPAGSNKDTHTTLNDVEAGSPKTISQRHKREFILVSRIPRAVLQISIHLFVMSVGATKVHPMESANAEV